MSIPSQQKIFSRIAQVGKGCSSMWDYSLYASVIDPVNTNTGMKSGLCNVHIWIILAEN